MVSPAEILTRLKTLGVKAEVRDGKLITRRSPDVTIPPDLAEAIRAHKTEIIRLLTGAAEADESPASEPTAPACSFCGSRLSAEDLEKYGDCPKCRQILPGWEDAPHPASPDPALNRALKKLTAELGTLEGYEADLAKAVLEAAGRDWPWPFDGLDDAERAALLAWAALSGEAGPPAAPRTAGFTVRPERCPACGGTRFYQPWAGPHAGSWFCVACNPGIRPETEPFRSGPEELRALANGIYALARRHGFPEVEYIPGRKVGPGPEAWKEALRIPLEAGYEAQLWAILFALEEAAAPESERAYADRLLTLAQALGYPELEGDSRCPGPIRRIPKGPVSWAVAAACMDPAERRYWLKRLKAEFDGQVCLR